VDKKKKELEAKDVEFVVDTLFKDDEPVKQQPKEIKYEPVKQQPKEIKYEPVKQQPKEIKYEPVKQQPVKTDKKKIQSVKVIKETKKIDWDKAIMWLSVLGIVGIIFLYQMVGDFSSGLALLLWLFGMMCFLPLGLILGWFFLDPYMRCKIMRKTRHKNYGIIYFVHKGGKRITTRIKNLDDDVIIHETKLWLIDKKGVYYLDVNGNKILNAEIDDASIVTLPSNVPALFLDPETMIPLRFHEEKSKTNPQQAGALLLGYINNQITKNLFFKKQMTMFYIILICITGITFALSMQTYMDFAELKETTIPMLENKLNYIASMLESIKLRPP